MGDSVGGALLGGGEDEVGGGELGGVVPPVGDAEVGGVERREEPCSVTVASPGVNRMRADHEPDGSREWSTRITRVTVSPGFKVPERAENSSQ